MARHARATPPAAEGATLVEHSKIKITSLNLPQQLTLEGLLDYLEEHSGRRLIAQPLTDSQGLELSGVRLSTADTDYVFYPTATSEPHREHILLRGFIQTALLGGSKGISSSDLETLMPDLGHDQVGPVLPVDPATSDRTLEAEVLATLVGERLVWPSLPQLPTMDGVLEELKPLRESLAAASGRASFLGYFDTASSRLYRTVIEISDAALALRPYSSPGVDRLARTAARRAGRSAEMADAFVEAACLEAARRARFVRPAGFATAAGPAGAQDYATEVSRLRRVAALHQSRELHALVDSAA
ncbi:DUF6545 domain-containing protein [Streptomyces hygroscopicus]|uniref:DUF6545 domain-containing protein n=1 Tax=Streptomyces hygroscopicus TaxID=1912 RepID=UPI001FCADBF1|nr:DUF6545 domain-containing protein [Streptomyces hygroscopicus]BDH10504.1 hypothetical protein HOK021_16830 [Streptomyces hygroscopicus]